MLQFVDYFVPIISFLAALLAISGDTFEEVKGRKKLNRRGKWACVIALIGLSVTATIIIRDKMSLARKTDNEKAIRQIANTLINEQLLLFTEDLFPEFQNFGATGDDSYASILYNSIKSEDILQDLVSDITRNLLDALDDVTEVMQNHVYEILPDDPSAFTKEMAEGLEGLFHDPTAHLPQSILLKLNASLFIYDLQVYMNRIHGIIERYSYYLNPEILAHLETLFSDELVIFLANFSRESFSRDIINNVVLLTRDEIFYSIKKHVKNESVFRVSGLLAKIFAKLESSTKKRPQNKPNQSLYSNGEVAERIPHK